MSTTDWKSPGTLTAVNRTGGAVAWSNPTNAAASDNSYATAALALNGSHWLWATNFGFGTGEVPSGAIITGLEVQWERKASIGEASIEPTFNDTYYNPIKSSALHGTQKTIAGDLPASDAYEAQGGAYDLWSGTWTDTDARASTTGIAIAYGSDFYSTVDVSADHIQIRWHYTASARYGDFFQVF